jgi:hypothetical protein
MSSISLNAGQHKTLNSIVEEFYHNFPNVGPVGNSNTTLFEMLTGVPTIDPTIAVTSDPVAPTIVVAAIVVAAKEIKKNHAAAKEIKKYARIRKDTVIRIVAAPSIKKERMRRPNFVNKLENYFKNYHNNNIIKIVKVSDVYGLEIINNIAKINSEKIGGVSVLSVSMDSFKRKIELMGFSKVYSQNTDKYFMFPNSFLQKKFKDSNIIIDENFCSNRQVWKIISDYYEINTAHH